MPEPGKSDKWNSLLETLGVPATEPPPKPAESAAEPPKAASAPPPRMGKPAPKPKAAPPAAKSPSYWSRIAGALGLETPAAAEPAPAPPAPPAPAPVAERPARRPEARSPEPVNRGREAPPDRTAPPPRKLESMFGPKEPDVDVFALDQGSERGNPAGGARSPDEPPRPAMHRDQPPSRREPAPTRREPPPASRREAPPPRRREAAPPPPPAAFSAEDDEGFVLDYEVEGDSDLNLLDEEPKLPADSADPEPEAPRRSGAEGGPRRDSEEGSRDGRRRRGRRRGRGRGGRREEGAPPPASQSPPPARYRDEDDELEAFGPPDAEFELDEGSDLDLGPEPIEAGPPAGDDDLLPPRRPERDDRGEARSRRGRRGGRGRGRGDRPPAGERTGGYGPRTPPREERDDLPVDELPLDDLPLEEGDELAEHEPDDVAGSGHPTHKKIPTWDEAVGVLIDANMAARADRPDRDRGRGGGGGGGGRGRGGRGRSGGGGGRGR